MIDEKAPETTDEFGPLFIEPTDGTVATSSPTATPTPPDSLNGTYRGFSPTDESGVAFGELEVVISDTKVAYRFATGLEILSDSVPRSELRALTPGEVAAFFKEGANATETSGYMIGEDGAVFLFPANEADEVPDSTVSDETSSEDEGPAPDVLLLCFVSDEIDAIFGPSCLYSPKQVQNGDYDRAVALIEAEQGDPGVIPSLANDGKRTGEDT